MRPIRVIGVPAIVIALFSCIAFAQDVHSRIIQLIISGQQLGADELLLTALLDLAEADKALSAANVEIVRGIREQDQAFIELAAVAKQNIELAKSYSADALRIFAELRQTEKEVNLSPRFFEMLNSIDVSNPLDLFESSTRNLDACLEEFLLAELGKAPLFGACLDISGNIRTLLSVSLGYGLGWN